MVYIVSLIVWIVLCAFVATWAERKGHKGVGYLFLSIFLSPLVGAIVVACIKNKNTKQCPFCKKYVDLNATVCSYCGKELVKKNIKNSSSEKDNWVSQRIVELISTGKNASDAKIQAEAEYSVNQMKKSTENTATSM